MRTADPSADGRRSAANFCHRRTAIGVWAYRLAAPGAIPCFVRVRSRTAFRRIIITPRCKQGRKLAYYGHTMRKQGSCLAKEIMQGTMPGARRRGRSCTAWMDNIKTWTGLSVKESIRMTEERDRWRKYVHGVAAQPSDRGRLKNRTEQNEASRLRTNSRQNSQRSPDSRTDVVAG